MIWLYPDKFEKDRTINGSSYLEEDMRSDLYGLYTIEIYYSHYLKYLETFVMHACTFGNVWCS